MKCLPVLLLASALASGCAHAQALAKPDAPLDVPAPPPRDVEPSEADTPPPAPPVAEPARSAPPRPRPAPAPREQPRAEPPKPEEEAPKPPTTLQTAPATVEGEVARAIRVTLTRANADLNRVNYRALNADARTQYDTAKRFIRQADDAIRTKNLVFAKNQAEKAAALAAQLGGR
jgi:hypothetical protein